MNLTSREWCERAGGVLLEPEADIGEDGRLAMGCLACHGEVARFGMATPVIYGDVSLDCEECGRELVRWRLF